MLNSNVKQFLFDLIRYLKGGTFSPTWRMFSRKIKTCPRIPARINCRSLAGVITVCNVYRFPDLCFNEPSAVWSVGYLENDHPMPSPKTVQVGKGVLNVGSTCPYPFWIDSNSPSLYEIPANQRKKAWTHYRVFPPRQKLCSEAACRENNKGFGAPFWERGVTDHAVRRDATRNDSVFTGSVIALQFNSVQFNSALFNRVITGYISSESKEQSI
jgi:hypothetical protein